MRRVVEDVPLPAPLSSADEVFDVTADLVAYTGLDRPAVEALLQRRPENFRSEWLAFPERFRADRWFYLSSRMYLFGNAVHVHNRADLVDLLEGLVPHHTPVLDFGGGTGNVALALAARGCEVDYLELSALQKDFTRFRIDKYGLADRVRVLDEWHELPRARYGLISAIDVLEHVPEIDEKIRQLLAGLVPGGVLVENTEFGGTAWNPMHLRDEHDLVGSLRSALELVTELNGFRTWRSASLPGPE